MPSTTNNEKWVKVAFIFAGIGLAGTAGYFTYRYIKKKKAASAESDFALMNNALLLPSVSTTSASTASAKSRNDNFPLKKGSKGTRVAMLQKALGIKDDGDFGSKTETALKDKGHPTSVDESTFNRIITQASALPFNPLTVAQKLYTQAKLKDYNGVMDTLALFKTKEDYKAAVAHYRTISEADSRVTKTIVTDLLSIAFKNDTTKKEAIKKEFLRMGLTMDVNGNFSLTGFPQKKLITLVDTIVHDPRGYKVYVKKNTVLGIEEYLANGIAYFKATDNRTYGVPNKDIIYFAR